MSTHLGFDMNNNTNSHRRSSTLAYEQNRSTGTLEKVPLRHNNSTGKKPVEKKVIFGVENDVTTRKSLSRSTSADRSGILRSAKSEFSLNTDKNNMTTTRTSTLSQRKIATLSDSEVAQVELMYRSHGTQVFVCSCLANLYWSAAHGRTAGVDWELGYTGIPVILLNLGDSRSRSRRQLEILIAERGTGFTLWRDTIDSLTRYTQIDQSFHTMLMSDNHSRLVGLSFDNSYSAMRFFGVLKDLTSDPQNVSLLPNNNGNNSVKLRKRHSLGSTARRISLRKNQISTPCCFQHVTSIKPADLINDSDSTSTGDNNNGTDHQLLSASKRAQSCIQISSSNVTNNRQHVF